MMHPLSKNTLAQAIAAITFGSIVATTNAQAQMLEEVIVTAQKKAESLQDTPIAISAFSSDDLEQIGAFSAVDVGEYTPNAIITRSLGSAFNLRVSIRGLGTAEPSLAVDPKVGVYLDGAYIARNAGSVFDVVDLERVEILRGPQGTLWGKNTTGGAINMVTKQPSGELGGKIDLSAGNFGHGRALATIESEEVGGFAAKFTYVKKVSDGWATNKNPASEKELGSEDTDAIRLALRWDISDNFSASYAYDRTDGEATAPATQVAFVDANTAPNIETIRLPNLDYFTHNAFRDMDKIANDDDRLDKFYLDNMESEEVIINGHNLTLSWMLGELEIRSITAYRDYDSKQNGLDLDGGSWLKYQDGVASTASIFHISGAKEQEQVSQEFQFLGTGFNSKLDYVVGLYYFDEEGKENNPWEVTFYNAANEINAFFDGTYGSWYEVTGKSAAAYGQGTWNFNDSWRLTLGARYTWDEKTLTLTDEDPGLDQNYKAKDDWSEPTGAATLTYFFNDDVNMYGKVSQGYAAGIYNPGTVGRNGVGPADPTAALVPADPEETTAYEIGVKSRFADGRVQLNAAVFLNDNTNLQSTDFVDGIRQTFNSGESETVGFEVDLIALLAENWTVNASYGYADTDYDQKDKFSTPLKTGNAGVQYDNQASYGMWTARLDATYMGETRFSISDPRVRSEPRTLLNTRVALSEMQALGGNFRLALWGKNLTDEEYIEHGANYGGYTGYTWGQPRSYGLDLAYEF